jgi:NTP pyrophosphatase (non-canonical NTP hydrolase)
MFVGKISQYLLIFSERFLKYNVEDFFAKITTVTMLKKLTKILTDFRDKRDWKKFHAPLNLAISLQLEVAELLEQFQWMDNEQFLKEYQDPKKRKRVEEEIADIFGYLLLLAHSLDIDLEKALLEKMKENEKKYPVEKAKGKSTKYTLL